MSVNKKVTIVGDEFRTNLLSLTEGGSTVEVHYANRVKVYTNVKNTIAYINAIKLKNETVDEKIVEVYINGVKTKHVWPRE